MSPENESNESPLGGNPSPNLSEAIEKLMAHPEILSMAASVLGQNITAPSPDADTQGTGKEAEETVSANTTPDSENGDSIMDALPDLMGLVRPMLSKVGNSDSGGKQNEKGLARSTALLLALKPFLSPARCEAVDKLVQIGKIGSLFEKLR